MTLELRLSLARFVRDREVRSVASFLDEVLCDMRGGDDSVRWMYDMFFASEPFRDQLIEFVIRQKAGVLGSMVVVMAQQYARSVSSSV